MSRRAPGIGAGCLLAALLLISFTACAPPDARRSEDVLVVAQVSEPVSMDPHVTTSLNDFRILVNIYEGLVRFRDGTLEPAPALARSWNIDDKGRTYTFRLRRGVRFHDGTPFNAEAVKFTFDRMLDEDHPYHHTGPFPLAFFFDAIEDIRVVDDHTVVFRLSKPFAPLLSNLAYPSGFIVSPAAVRKYGRDFGRHPAGTGPFRFTDWVPRHRVLLERHDGYHGHPARLRHVVFRPLNDPMTRIAELMAGGVDMVTELAPDQVALMRDNPDYRVHEKTGPHLWYLILNTREGPFRDVRMRRAVNLAINREELVAHVLQHTAEMAAGPVPAAFARANDPRVVPYPYDPDRARRLMAQAGHADGADVTLLVPQGGSGMLAPVQMATAIQADLARVGIRVTIRTFEWNTYLAKVNGGLAGAGDMAEMAWITNNPDTLPYLTLRSGAFPEHGGFNSGYYSNGTVDELILAARAETDHERRAALYHRLERIVQREAPWVVVASWRQNVVTGRGVRGFRLQPSFFLSLHRTYKTGTTERGP